MIGPPFTARRRPSGVPRGLVPLARRGSGMARGIPVTPPADYDGRRVELAPVEPCLEDGSDSLPNVSIESAVGFRRIEVCAESLCILSIREPND